MGREVIKRHTPSENNNIASAVRPLIGSEVSLHHHPVTPTQNQFLVISSPPTVRPQSEYPHVVVPGHADYVRRMIASVDTVSEAAPAVPSVVPVNLYHPLSISP